MERLPNSVALFHGDLISDDADAFSFLQQELDLLGEHLQSGKGRLNVKGRQDRQSFRHHHRHSRGRLYVPAPVRLVLTGGLNIGGGGDFQ